MTPLPPAIPPDLAARLARVYLAAQQSAAQLRTEGATTMYEPDPRTWQDLLCDEAPPLPVAVRAEVQRAAFEPRADTLLTKLLTCGEFTSVDAAERCGCWPSSIRTTLRNHPGCFEQVRARHGAVPALWRAKPGAQP